MEHRQASLGRYLREWLRRGYWHNRYEHQARRYARLQLPALLALLGPDRDTI